MSALKGVIDLRYFGSIVRADADAVSDVDVLCVVEDKSVADLSGVHLYLDKELVGDRELDISVYGKDRISEMFQEGHLFAWHIYKESQPINVFDGFISALGEPSCYGGAVQDIASLMKVLREAQLAIVTSDSTLVYEVGLLYVVARNIGISASWYSDNGLDFSRFAPYSLVLNGKNLRLDLPQQVYGMLCACRHASVRGSVPPELQKQDVITWFQVVERWSNSVLKEIEVIL